MRVLVVGEGHSAIHEVAAAQALRELGHSVEGFYWHHYFRGSNTLATQFLRLQNKLITGPAVARLNRDLIAKAAAFRPELLFLYRGTHVAASSILQLREALPACKVFAYCNDDPFSPRQPLHLWRHFLQAVPLCDVAFAYRKRNISDFLAAGAPRAELLMPWFIPSALQPSAPATYQENLTCDVVFIGHYERDHRLTYIKALVESGIDFKLFGPDWSRAPGFTWLAPYQPVTALTGPHYYRALQSARIALCFFSKLNRDTYTRRCFEIPAAGTFMLSEYSPDAAGMFREGKEADFFRSPREMLSKIRMYLSDSARRTSIANAGHRRVYNDGHDVVTRMRMVMRVAETI